MPKVVNGSKQPGVEPPAPAAPEAPSVLVKFHRLAILDGGDVAAAGEYHRLPEAEAARHIAAGRASNAGVRVRALVAHNVNFVYRNVGEEFELPLDLAVSLHRHGGIQIIDSGALAGGLQLPPVLPRPKLIEARDPWEGIARVKVRALRPCNVGLQGLHPDQEAEVPETWATQAAACGAVTILGLPGLVDRVAHLLD
jgi:hypothetical protein